MATTAVDKAIDVAADVVEDVAEESAQVAEAMREWSGRDVGLGITFGLGAGVFAGSVGAFFILSRKLKTKYEAIADEEIQNMKEYYNSKLRALENEKEKGTLEEVSREIQTRQEVNDGEGQTPYHTMYAPGGSEPDKAPDVVVQNVFVENANEDPEVTMDPTWNYDEELRNRTPTTPYVIHKDEYDEGVEQDDWEQYTLTYFEGDDVLCREDDRVIEDQDSVVGLGNLSRFGHGSGDPNIVYVRNHELKVDIEIVHSDGKYATEVAGFQEDELQHSATMKRRLPRRSEYDADN